MPRHRDLQCPSGCPERRFEVLGAALVVGPDGGYLEHDDAVATFVCASCGSVAVDLEAAAMEMRRARAAGSGTPLTCPACATVMLPPQDDPLAALVECPACGERFGVEEGARRLHGGGAADEAGETA